MKLEDIMSSDYQTISEDATIFEAVQMMTKHKVYGIIVTNADGFPVGLLSERSLIKRFILRNKRPDEVPVKAVMRRPLPSVPHNLSLPKVAEYLVRNGLERTTVTNNGKVVGYVTVSDMAGYLSRKIIWDILSSHRVSDFIYFCPRCGSGQLKPVYGEKGEIKVFSCNNDRCDYQE
ncbi:MAG: CBS domain-containing protein [Methanomassiliicoccales archaeon]|nr:CBS domain-containing protein [Methanomassiliicoccales archaeon]